VITLAKGLGGGVPIGAMVAREPVASAFQPGDHASTFGGSALPAAAAVATLTVIEEEGLVQNAARVGARLAQGLEALREKCALINEVRARGLMIGVDLTKPVAAKVKGECLKRGLLITTVGDQMLRLLPPLVLSETQADRGLAILEAALREAE
jgi:acetylornithine/succinyldiaminopimelate/putrescine aminotransferase